MKTWSWGNGPFPVWADLGESFSISLAWNAEDESESDKRSCSFYCGACTESSCIHTQLLGFEGIGSTLLFVWVLALSSLFFPPISVSPALLLVNKYKLAFSHSLTNCHSTSHAHGSVSGICPLEVSLHCCLFFSFESLNLLGSRYMEVYSVGIQMVCHDLIPNSVQGVG